MYAMGAATTTTAMRTVDVQKRSTAREPVACSRTLGDAIRFFHSQDAQEKAREHRLYAERQQHGGRDDLAHRESRIQVAEADCTPAQNRHDDAENAGGKHQPTDGQAGL